jgi:hypothetical protein
MLFALRLFRGGFCLPMRMRRTGGEGGIRTPDRGVSPYNGLANRRLQPLGHLSVQIKNGKNECDPTLSRSSLANSARDFGCGLPLRLRLAHARKTRLLGPLRSVLRPSLLPIGDAGSVQRSAHDVITHAWEVFYAASADQHNRVLLQVVPYAGDIGRHFDSIGQANAGHLAQSRIRLFWRLGVNTRANAAALRARLQGRAGRLIIRRRSALSNQLIECRHVSLLNLPFFAQPQLSHTRAGRAF